MSDPVVYQNDNVVMYDCDDTLVMWDIEGEQGDDIILTPWNGYHQDSVRIRPHKKHIELLKQFHARGQMTVVWSAGGYDWASRVVKELKLEPYVTLVMSKPKWYVDDLPAEEILGTRIYHKQEKQAQPGVPYIPSRKENEEEE